MAQFFKGYVNYNCDQCGLWKDVYKDPFTVMNSWESYYTSEWPYIQTGAKEAAALGKQNGILAGVWEYGGSVDYNPILTNSKNGGSPSYKSMLDWSYANGIGFNHFHVWCGLNSAGLARYKELGFEQVVADLQTYYPPTGAAPSGGWGEWSSLGGQLASGTSPAVCAQNANSLDVFVVGTDNALWHKHYQSTSGWGNWESLGGYLTSDPAAVSRSAGKITVFVRGSSGSLWSMSTTDGGATWSGWNEIGGQLLAGTSPTAYAWGNDRIGWLVTGTNNVLYHMWDDAAGRHGWENLGGYLTSSPAATSSGSGAIDVFVRGGSGALWQMEYNNGWSGWTAVGGEIAPGTTPAACSWGPGRLDVFVTGTSGALWHRWYASGVWSGWESLGGYLTSSPAAAGSGGNRIDVLVRGGTGALWQREYNNV